MAPFNAQATLWFRDAFAALYLPTTVHGRVSDIWRSYAAQAAFRCQGLSLAFSPPVVEQDRNAHDFMGDYMSERPLYEEAGALVEYLLAWPCPSGSSLPAVFERLFVDLYERGFIEVRIGRLQAFHLIARRTTARRCPGGPTGTSGAAGERGGRGNAKAC